MVEDLKHPIWLELTGTPYRVTSTRSWPFLPAVQDELTEIADLANSFLNKPTQLFVVKTSSTKGVLYLQHHHEIGGYRGIWLPTSFPSLNTLVKPILEVWNVEIPDFDKWIQQFFALRLDPDYLEYYQSQDNFSINLPPPFVLSNQQISGNLLYNLRSSIDRIEELTLDHLHTVIDEHLPPAYRELITKIAKEKDITLIYLVNAYLHTVEMISHREFLHLRQLIGKISPHLADYLLISYLTHRVSNQHHLDDELRSTIEDELEITEGMRRIAILRLLYTMAQEQDDIVTQEQYFQELLNYAPRNSWNPKLDLINAQLGLAKCSVDRGDYFRALTFYSFARQGFASVGSKAIGDKMKVEYQRISVLAANQQIQTGLYNINHLNLSRHSFLTLIDGIQSGLTHFIRYAGEPIELEMILPTILKSAATTLRLYSKDIDDLFPEPLNYDAIIHTVDQLADGHNRSQLIPALQDHIEQLSFKDQKMIEMISIFYKDGRHIGDYTYRESQFVQVDQNASQTLFSSAMSAVNMLITEATQSDTSVDEISIGNKTVIYETGEYITFCLIAKSSNSNLKNILKSVVRSIEQEYHEFLPNWSGNLGNFSNIEHLLKPLSFYTIDKGEKEFIQE